MFATKLNGNNVRSRLSAGGCGLLWAAMGCGADGHGPEAREEQQLGELRTALQAAPPPLTYATDADFPPSVGAWAFAAAHRTSSGTGPANTRYSRTSLGTGGDITVTRVLQSYHYVDFPDLGQSVLGNAQVSAYGGTSNRCKLNSLQRSPTGGTRVYVLCSTPSGSGVDTPFLVSLVSRTDEFGPAGGAYWMGDSNSWNSSGAANTSRNVSTGRYEVTFPNQSHGSEHGNVLVTAVGAGASYCNAFNWVSRGTDVVADVRCFTSSGSPTNSGFSIQYSPFWAGGGHSGGHARRYHRVVLPELPDGDSHVSVYGMGQI